MKKTIAILALVALFGSSVAAASTRATRGDATAVLNAFGSGGWAVLNHSPAAVGAPANGLCGQVTIRPFSGSPCDGAHYCALDWHTIVLADFEPGPYTAAAAVIGALDFRFTLDGAALPVTKTPVQRFLRIPSTELYYSQWGRVMAPGDIAPGAHSLSVVETDAGTPVFSDGITFFVDPAGTGACL